MIAGFIVNKFRGDPSLFSDGMATIARHTGWQPLGLVPFFDAAHRLAGGGRARTSASADLAARASARLIVVLAYPRISNFDDFDPLRLEPGVELVFLKPGEPIPGNAALVILPGSKATDRRSRRAARKRMGHRPQGACASRRPCARNLWRVSDARHSHLRPGRDRGTGRLGGGAWFTGCRNGASGRQGARRDLRRERRRDGAASRDTRCMSDAPSARDARDRCLHFADGRKEGAVSGPAASPVATFTGSFPTTASATIGCGVSRVSLPDLVYEADVEETLDRLADHIERHIDCDRLFELARVPDFKETP